MPRTRVWLLTIITLFVASFLVAFAPVRHIRGGSGAAPHIFTFSFSQPLFDQPAGQSAAETALKKLLTDAGLTDDDVEYARFVEGQPTRVEVSTYATTWEESRRHFEAITAALRAKYPDVEGTMPGGRQDEPLWRIGPIGVFAPRPHVRLGLDLQGGSQLVLRLMPETVMTFESPVDRPMIVEEPAPAGAEGAAAAATPPSDWDPGQTKESLTRSIQAALVAAGTAEADMTVQVVAPYRVQVTTRAQSKREADHQADVIKRRLAELYPNLQIEAKPPSSIFIEGATVGQESTAEKVRNVIERRLYGMTDIREPVTQVQGADRIIVEIPGVKDPDAAKKLLQKTAMLKLALIPTRYKPTGANSYDEWRDDQAGGQIVPWERVLSEATVEFRGSDLKSNSQVQTGPTGEWVVSFELLDERKQAFAKFTRANTGRLMAIVLDDTCQMAPVIEEEIRDGKGIIRGDLSLKEAKDLKLLLNAGALPVPLEVVEDRTVSATLGQDSIRQSLVAGLLGFALIAVFMIAFYRLPGALADLALALYVMMLLAVIAAPVVFGISGVGAVTLTLPGIFGIILSVGMAVDANVLIFERLKEELWAGKSMRAAVEEGFHRAWTAVLDTNVTTLITCAVLYFLGTSAIKSFAVTLFLGVALSLFTAVTVSRWLVTMVANTSLGRRLELFGVRKEDIRSL